jgi:hypothetical protein
MALHIYYYSSVAANAYSKIGGTRYDNDRIHLNLLQEQELGAQKMNEYCK